MDLGMTLGVAAAIVAILLIINGASARKRQSLRASHQGSPKETTSNTTLWTSPVTTQKDACQMLSDLLKANGYGERKHTLSTTLSDFRLEMKEHVEHLQGLVEFAKHEVRNQSDYRTGIREELDSAIEESASSRSDEGDAFIAKKQRHLGHLDREIAERETELSNAELALKAFRADRRSFVNAYAAHVVGNAANPNAARA